MYIRSHLGSRDFTIVTFSCDFLSVEPSPITAMGKNRPGKNKRKRYENMRLRTYFNNNIGDTVAQTGHDAYGSSVTESDAAVHDDNDTCEARQTEVVTNADTSEMDIVETTAILRAGLKATKRASRKRKQQKWLLQDSRQGSKRCLNE